MRINNYISQYNILAFNGINKQENNLLEELLKDSTSDTYLFENPKFYEFFENNKEAMTEKIKQMYNKTPWGKSKGRNIIPEFTENVSAKHIALICDPGIASRLNEFYDFVKQYSTNIDSMTTLELRKNFSDYLGNQRYYRAMMLTEQQAEEIKTKGIISNNFNGDEAKNIFNDLLLGYKNPKSVSYKDFIYGKVNGMNRNNPLISISKSKEIAKEVSQNYTLDTRGKKNYIFELEIPKINVIEPKGEFDVTYPGLDFFDKNGNQLQKEDVESFVPFIIDSKYIIGCTLG